MEIVEDTPPPPKVGPRWRHGNPRKKDNVCTSAAWCPSPYGSASVSADLFSSGSCQSVSLFCVHPRPKKQLLSCRSLMATRQCCS